MVGRVFSEQMIKIKELGNNNPVLCFPLIEQPFCFHFKMILMKDTLTVAVAATRSMKSLRKPKGGTTHMIQIVR